MTRTRNSLPSSSSVSVRKSDTGGAGIQSVTIAVAIRLTSRVIETMTEIIALLLRVGSSLAMDNAAKALQFPNVAASLNRIEHQPSKLRVAGSSPAEVASLKAVQKTTVFQIWPTGLLTPLSRPHFLSRIYVRKSIV